MISTRFGACNWQSRTKMVRKSCIAESNQPNFSCFLVLGDWRAWFSMPTMVFRTNPRNGDGINPCETVVQWSWWHMKVMEVQAHRPKFHDLTREYPWWLLGRPNIKKHPGMPSNHLQNLCVLTKHIILCFKNDQFQTNPWFFQLQIFNLEIILIIIYPQFSWWKIPCFHQGQVTSHFWSPSSGLHAVGRGFYLRGCWSHLCPAEGKAMGPWLHEGKVWSREAMTTRSGKSMEF